MTASGSMGPSVDQDTEADEEGDERAKERRAERRPLPRRPDEATAVLRWPHHTVMGLHLAATGNTHLR